MRPLSLRMAAAFALLWLERLSRMTMSLRFGEQFLELGVLILKRTKPLGFPHLQTAEFRLSLVNGRRADAVAAAYLHRRHARLLLL
jgi:hypothetical protein